MCGIAGALALNNSKIAREVVIAMARSIQHRGPEVIGIFDRHPVLFAHDRLSIIDLTGGLQPLYNEDKSIFLICNGEFFNHVEIREELRAKGHTFRTGSDSEVLIHLYEEYGIERAINTLNGQWATALWDERRRKMILSRDRLGVRPLFYTLADGVLYFASEMKALLRCPGVARDLSLETLDQVLNFWAPLPGHTMFRNIHEVPPGHYVTINADDGALKLTRYWELDFPDVREFKNVPTNADKWLAGLRELLEDAVKLRLLRADVAVGAYLSGGLDSSVITALARQYASGKLETFSVAFSEPGFDERKYQELMAQHLGTNHHVLECSHSDIGRALPEVIWHAEVPMLRTAPVPLFLLSGQVRQSGMKVVLTGEGSDEFLGGYDIFREAKIRRFWARQPESKRRPELFRKVHNYIAGLNDSGRQFQNAFWAQGMEQTDDLFYSHRPRWRNMRRLRLLLSSEAQNVLQNYNAETVLAEQISKSLPRWHPLAQAQYLEINTFLSTYLLSTQGDRVAMANSVEGRFPFLDYRVVAYCNAMPPELKLRGLTEKWILKQLASDLVPEQILKRVKQPYRAPIKAAFADPQTAEYVRAMLDPAKVAATGVFNPLAVQKLWNKTQTNSNLSEVDQMGLMGVLTFQLWHTFFCEGDRSLIKNRYTDVEIVEVV